MADAQTPVLTDEQIEAALQKAGGRWSGDYWVIEDADLHPFVRGVLAAQAPAQPMQPAEASWDRFIERLNTVQPLSKLTKHGHKNLLGSVAHYKAIFLAANADQSPAPSQSGRAVMQQALDAIDAEMDEEWECNAYHPKLHAARTVLRATLIAELRKGPATTAQIIKGGGNG